MMHCPAASDQSFGPRVDTSCRSFDFTLQFEDIFLACLPAGLFLILSPLRIVILLYRPALIESSLNHKVLWSKLIILTGLFGIQLTFIVLRIQDSLLRTNSSTAADILCLLATSTALTLSFLSHKRSPRPSTLLSLYLSASVILGVVRTRTLWLLAPDHLMPALITVILSLTVVALLLESIENPALRSATKDNSEYRSFTSEQRSGFWARTCFTWLATTFWLGHKKIISVEDLPALDTKLRSQTLGRELALGWEHYDHHERHSLLRACFRSYLLSFLSPIIPRICLTSFTFAQPFLISTTINFVSKTNPDSTYGKGLIGAWALVYLGIAVSSSIYRYQTFRFTTRLRGGLIGLIYQRTLQIREADMGEITAISLMGTDVERIVEGMQFFHEVWGSLLDIAIASWLLGRQLFLACIAPIVLVLVLIAITSKVSLSSKTAQLRWIEKVQERLRVSSTMLDEIKAIKMLGLTGVMSDIVHSLRVDEIKTSQVFRKLLVLTLLLSLAPINLAPVVTFALYVIISVFWKNETLLTDKAFTSTALISLLVNPVVFFLQVLPVVVQCIACFDRIQEYCNYKPNLGDEGKHFTMNQGNTDIKLERLKVKNEKRNFKTPPFMLFNGQSLGFNKNGPAVLKTLEVEIQTGALTAIIGPVGSGKSAFLSSLLGEMHLLSEASGKSCTGPRGHEPISYCSQQPWLENITVRANITGLAAIDQNWYARVVYSCGLDDDIRQLQNGDNTRVGSKGLSLSGGQKQRLALARAIYARNSVIILDDVFSGMDAHTTDIVSSRLLGPKGLLRMIPTTVIIATHSLKIMSLMDFIIAFDNGRIIETGKPATLIENDGYVNSLRLSLPSLDNEYDSISCLDEDPQRFHGEYRNSDSTSGESHSLDDIRRKNGDMSVYKYYLSNAGYLVVGFYVLSVIIWVFCIEFSSVWIKWWSETNSRQPNKDIGLYMGIYAMLGVIGTFGILMAAWFAFIPVISNTATKLHYDLLETTLRAPLQFFTKNDNGDILNRFSQDMELIDMELPWAMVNYTSTAFTILVKIGILAIFSQYLGAAIPFLGLAVFIIQRFYLQTSRQVRLLGIEAQAPLYTHFSEAVSGSSHIRAFGWQMNYQDRNYRLIDTSQRPMYIQNCIQAWLTFVLNLLVAVLAVVLVGTVVRWHDKFSAGSVGVSLLMILGFSETLVRLIKSWTRLESSIGAVARVKRFTIETESEEVMSRSLNSVPDWPLAGAIEFSRVVAFHEPGTEAVLKGLSMSIRPGQHVAICGRSGSGKTSLILSLLQMIHVPEGKITLDGVDLSTITRENICSHINVVSQDPLLIPGTIRFNIDPSLAVSEVEVTQALRLVGLWTMVQDQGGLNKDIDTKAWSAGQKQLLCLARAIVKKAKILVLDEAMSSVDSETESIMQGIIDTTFRECTVLAVMHRLKHVARYDMIALLGDGELLEYGERETLLADGTQFAELYRLNAH